MLVGLPAGAQCRAEGLGFGGTLGGISEGTGATAACGQRHWQGQGQAAQKGNTSVPRLMVALSGNGMEGISLKIRSLVLLVVVILQHSLFYLENKRFVCEVF